MVVIWVGPEHVVLKKLVWSCMILLGGLGWLGFVGGYLGALHPAADLLAVGRGAFGAVALIWALMLPAPYRLLPLGLVLGGLGWHLSGHLGRAQAPPLAQAQVPVTPPLALRVYQKNLQRDRIDRGPMLAHIRKADPDILLVQEVSKYNLDMLAALRDRLPHQHVCDVAGANGNAILSRWPLAPGGTACIPGAARAVIDTPSGPLSAVSLHLSWPWPYAQPEMLATIEPFLRQVSGPAIVGGDFNAVAWSHTLRRVEAATGTRRAGPFADTFDLGPLPGMGIGIDHILVSGRIYASIAVAPRLGSDHHGLIAQMDYR